MPTPGPASGIGSGGLSFTIACSCKPVLAAEAPGEAPSGQGASFWGSAFAMPSPCAGRLPAASHLPHPPLALAGPLSRSSACQAQALWLTVSPAMALLQERLVRPPAKEAEAMAEPLPTAHMEVIRLTQEEIGYAPIAVAGALAEGRALRRASCPLQQPAGRLQHLQGAGIGR